LKRGKQGAREGGIAHFDHRPAYLELQAQIDEALGRVLLSRSLILGPEVRDFEREFAAYVGVPSAVGVASGTDALALALRALEVGPGDEVLTVANAGVPPVSAIRSVGAVPRFVDVDPETLLLDPARLEEAVTSRTRCVLPVHLYGQPAALDAILEVAGKHDLRVVEDCAQAHGARYGGRHVGGFGDVGCFSFYPTKNLGAFGDGGLCVTGDPAIEERLRMLRTYGFRGDRHAHCEGWNSRLDEVQAAVLRVKLRHLDEAIAARREIAARYREGLADCPVRIPGSTPRAEHAYHLFVVQSSERPRLIEALEQAGIGYGIHYPEPVHLMEAYAFLGCARGELPVSERASRTVLSLPLYPGLGAEAVERVVQTLRSGVPGARGGEPR
jgi:dTDP-4-amino-4,6-dideoxygalactose transaminase